MLHEITKHVYAATKKLFGLQVLTENGFEDVDSVNVTEPSETVVVKTATRILKCSKKHIFIKADGEEVYAQDCLGQELKTVDGAEKVISVEPDAAEPLYDVSLADGTTHRYYANGILSHNCVIADEFSFVPNNIASKVFESIYPVISSSKNSQFIIVSTPNGADPNNLYYSIWQQANFGGDSNSEGWRSFRFDWWDVPGRDEQWKRNTIASIGERRFSQEFGNEFLASSTSKKLIDDSIIERFRMKLSEYRAKEIKPKECRVLSQDEKKIFTFRMWREFSPDCAYLASADISEGIGGDSSVLYVWDVTDLSRIEMVAAFSSNRLKLVEFAYVARKMLALYGDPWLFAERNGVSAGMIDSLKVTYGYERIAAESKNGEAGIYSHVTVKEKATLWARDMITTQGFGFVIYDKELVDEMQSFVKKDTSGVRAIFSAAAGAHDDHIMTLVWACWGLSPKLVEKYYIVCDTFKTQLDELYPKILAPLTEYSSDQLKSINQDPIYRDFMDFKKDCLDRLSKAAAIDKAATRSDPFKYTFDDMYFTDDPDDCGMWGGGGRP